MAILNMLKYLLKRQGADCLTLLGLEGKLTLLPPTEGGDKI